MRVFGRRYSAVDVATGTDRVLFGYPIPPGGQLNNIWADIHVLGPETVSFQSAVMYGVSAFGMMVPDAETAIAFDTLWDNFVPKDVAESSGAFDLDTDAADATAEFEMGEPDVNAIFDLASNAPMELYRRRKMLTIANGQAAYATVAASPDLWTPADAFKLRIRRNMRVSSPSVVMVGFSSPGMNVTTTTPETTPTESQWAWLTYLEMGLEQAFIHLMGLVETGAETPWEEAGAFVVSLLERAAFEEAAASFAAATYRVFSTAVIDITVPGSVGQKTLSSE